jgi:hypothetical protein
MSLLSAFFLFLCSLNGLPFRCLVRGPAGRCGCQLGRLFTGYWLRETPKAVPKLDGHVDWLVAENWLKAAMKMQSMEKVGVTAILRN